MTGVQTCALPIWDNVSVAANVMFCTHDAIRHVFMYEDKMNYLPHLGEISVSNNVFIGAGSIIVGPLKIGANVIIAAGSVLTKDVPDGVIVGGNPARVIGTYEDLKNKRKKEIEKSSLS